MPPISRRQERFADSIALRREIEEAYATQDKPHDINEHIRGGRPMAIRMHATHIDNKGTYLWQIIRKTPQKMRALVKRRSANMELMECDGCENRHTESHAHCSANTGASWLSTLPDTGDYVQLYSLGADRKRMAGTWRIDEEESDGVSTTAYFELSRIYR